MNSKVENYLKKEKNWKPEMEALHKILLDCGLTEELKWGKPCYSFEGNNIAILQGFKDSCALMFFKGTLLKDPENILKKPGENSRIARRIEFKNIEEIGKLRPVLKSYIFEAIEVEKTGLKVKIKKEFDLEYPKELQHKLKENLEFKTAFEALTPGRKRGYLLHFSGAKQSKTREARIEKNIPKIMKGKGLNDR